MAAAPASRLALVEGHARKVAISIAGGVAFVFLMFVGRQEVWGWRLALYGALGGFAIHVCCHVLDATVGDRIRRRQIVPDRLVGIPLYFVGGCVGGVAVTAVLQAAGLMPFDLTARDYRIALLISGGVAIVFGLLFYSFEVMQRRLSESVERIKAQEFAEKELALARAIQSRLLPPEELAGDGYRIAARNLPARVVAGDFYDVFRLADGALGIVVADVSGKGMGASLIMASVKAVLPFVAEGRSAAATLTELNCRLARELTAREFVALAYARFEPATGALELANAGLPDPYLLRGGAVDPLSVPGPRLPLGARSEVAYESLALEVRPGERLLLLTDGLPEAPTSAGQPLGYEALARLLPVAAATPGDLLDRLFGAVREATGPVLEDDWTALVLEASG
jgi:hypothetical protein